MRYNTNLYLLTVATLISAVAISACSGETPLSGNEDIIDGIPTSVGISIGTLRSGGAPDGIPSEPEEQEKIHTWRVVFTDRGGVVREIVDRTATGAVEVEAVECTVPSGVYDIYAFANISEDELAESAGISFTKEEKISLPAGVTEIDDAVYDLLLAGRDATLPLPMTGFLKNVRIRNGVEESFSIEVVRMAAKMEFQFSNTSDHQITINSISVDPVTSTEVSLFPRGATGIDYSHLGYSAYTPVTGAEYDIFTFSPSTGNTLDAEGETSMKFYIPESLSQRANNAAFTIGIKVMHRDDANNMQGMSEYQQYNITSDILSYINRNDHIVIPVRLSRYDVDVRALFYPPIGGYPAVNPNVDPDGAQIFTFLSDGDFSVTARVTDKLTGTHLPAQRYSMELGATTDPDGILSAPLQVVTTSAAIPDELTGTLTEKTGKAIVTLTVKIYDRPLYETGAKVTDTYTRKIHIIRK